MRIALSPHEPPPDEELARTLSLTLPLEEAWALEATRMMVEHMGGTSAGSHWLESLLAEGTISLLELIPPSENNLSTKAEAKHTAWREQMQRTQHLQASAELQSRPAVTPDPNPGQAPDPSDIPTGLEALDRCIRYYSAELASRDLFFGRIAQRFLALRGWQALGFATEAHYARERLGISRASLRSKVALAHRTQGLDHIIDALQAGHIGLEAAQLIARIATPDTERAWLTRATRRTFKHLREEVQAVEMATRFLGETNHSPPSEQHIQQMQSVERAILSGELLRKVTHNSSTERPTDEPPNDTVQISVGPKDEAPNDAVQISVTPGSKVTLRIRVPADLLLHYRELERLHRQKRPGESFIQFLCTTFWQTWVPHLGTSDKWEADLPPRSLPLHQPRLPQPQRHPPPRAVPRQRRHRRPGKPHHPLRLLPPRRRTRRPPKNPSPRQQPHLAPRPPPHHQSPPPRTNPPQLIQASLRSPPPGWSYGSASGTLPFDRRPI